MEKVLVTGGAGFIGSHVVDELISSKYEPIVVDNLRTGKKENLPKQVRLYEVDITDKKSLQEIFEKEKPSYVLHLAAQTNIRFSLNNPEEDANINVLGSVNVLECSRLFNVKKLVYLTSGGTVYGQAEKLPTSESSPKKTITCHYGVSKYCTEVYLELYNYLYGLNYVILRLANVYGARQDPKGESGVISIFADNLMSNKQSKIFGDGEQTRDFIYVTDVAKIAYLCIKSNTLTKIFNVGTGIKTSINELYQNMSRITNSNLSAIHTDQIKGELKHSCLDSSLAEKELSWKHQINLFEGLKKTLEWFKNERKN